MKILSVLISSLLLISCTKGGSPKKTAPFTQPTPFKDYLPDVIKNFLPIDDNEKESDGGGGMTPSFCESFIASQKLAHPTDETFQVLTSDPKELSCKDSSLIFNYALTDDSPLLLKSVLAVSLASMQANGNSSMEALMELTLQNTMNRYNEVAPDLEFNQSITRDAVEAVGLLGKMNSSPTLVERAKAAVELINAKIIASPANQQQFELKRDALSAIDHAIQNMSNPKYRSTDRVLLLDGLLRPMSQPSLKSYEVTVRYLSSIFADDFRAKRPVFQALIENSRTDTEAQYMAKLETFKSQILPLVGPPKLSIYSPNVTNTGYSLINIDNNMTMLGTCYPDFKSPVTVVFNNLQNIAFEGLDFSFSVPCQADGGFSIPLDFTGIFPMNSISIGVSQSKIGDDSFEDYKINKDLIATMERTSKVNYSFANGQSIMLDGYGRMNISGTCEPTDPEFTIDMRIKSSGEELAVISFYYVSDASDPNYGQVFKCSPEGTFSYRVNFKELAQNYMWYSPEFTEYDVELSAQHIVSTWSTKINKNIKILNWVDDWTGDLVTIDSPSSAAELNYPRETNTINVSGRCNLFVAPNLKIFAYVGEEQVGSADVSCNDGMSFDTSIYISPYSYEGAQTVTLYAVDSWNNEVILSQNHEFTLFYLPRTVILHP